MKFKKFLEGEIFVRWVNKRLSKNKNCIIVTTGATGSGKTYNDLRKAELIYKKNFKQDFPIDNCCFSVSEFMERISVLTQNPKKGEVLILEEAGVNVGSGDWQNKIVKMFNYLLQSFRSMNVILLMNLPVLTMLAKQARQLVHLHMETNGINFDDNTIQMKALFHQLNQHSGKSYWKHMRILINNKMIPVEKMWFNMPSERLTTQYEIKKAKFLAGMSVDFINELRRKEQDKINKLARTDMSAHQLEIYNLLKSGMRRKDVALKMGTSVVAVRDCIISLNKKGYFPEDGARYKAKKARDKLNSVEV